MIFFNWSWTVCDIFWTTYVAAAVTKCIEWMGIIKGLKLDIILTSGKSFWYDKISAVIKSNAPSYLYKL